MGDSTGTNAGGLATAYAGGEMIVQTRNAGFGLVYMGANDGGGAVIPPAFRGWWLTEINYMALITKHKKNACCSSRHDYALGGR